jgi:hypothetical protein
MVYLDYLDYKAIFIYNYETHHVNMRFAGQVLRRTSCLLDP